MAQNKNFFLHYVGVVVLVTILALGVLSFIANYAINNHDFYLSREISVNDFVVVLVTIIIAVVVPFTVGSLVENRKISRELLIKLCDKIQNDLHALKQISSIAKDTEKDKYITEIIETIGYITDGSEKLRKNIAVECNSFDVVNLTNKTDDLKIFATDNLRDTTFSFSDLYKSEIKRKINHLDNELEDTKFSINNVLS